MMNLQSWSEQSLQALHSTASLIGLAAAAVILLCICLVYFSGTELTARLTRKAQATGNGNVPAVGQTPAYDGAAERQKALASAARVSQLEAELTTARHSDESNKTRLGQLERELSEARLSEKTSAARLSQLERELSEARLSEKTSAGRLSQLELDLTNARRVDEEKGSRLAQLEADLKKARQSTDQAQAETKRVESEQGPRTITPEQRKLFGESIRGLPTGKVLVSAFFENKETHEFGTELLNLLKSAGFTVVERAPVNFFTTSRPSSGIRIGCQDINNPPPHFETVRKGLQAIGLDAPTTSIVNAEEDDLIELQVTPKQ